MKMLIAIVYEDNVETALQALTAAAFRVTRIASTGGFFRKGNVTLLMGVEDERQEEALRLLRENLPAAPAGEKRATVFVIPVTRFEQI